MQIITSMLMINKYFDSYDYSLSGNVDYRNLVTPSLISLVSAETNEQPISGLCLHDFSKGLDDSNESK